MASRLHETAAELLSVSWLRKRRRSATTLLDRSGARLAAVRRAIAATSLHEEGQELARLVFGDGTTAKRIAEAEEIISLYLHDRCLIEQVRLLDADGEPEIAGFRKSLVKSLAVSAVGILLDRAAAPLEPAEPYPLPVQLLERVWNRMVLKQ